MSNRYERRRRRVAIAIMASVVAVAIGGLVYRVAVPPSDPVAEALEQYSEIVEHACECTTFECFDHLDGTWRKVDLPRLAPNEVRRMTEILVRLNACKTAFELKQG